MKAKGVLTAAALSLLPLGQALLLGTLGITTVTTAVVLQAAPLIAQDASAVAKVAKAITVRIEGAGSPGSGVLVKQEGNRYTVLTAWHVVSGNRPGEELAIFTPDGKEHQLEQGSIERLGEVDMAVLTFSSSGAYEVASIGDVKSVSMGNQIFVAGFSLASSDEHHRILDFQTGDVIANTSVLLPNGYQLLYSNLTLPGMSGGAVLNSQAQLVAIHGLAETDAKLTKQLGISVKTGTNQAVPINYYKMQNHRQSNIASKSKAKLTDDHMTKAKTLWLEAGKTRKDKIVKLEKIVLLAKQSILIKESAEAYRYLGLAISALRVIEDPWNWLKSPDALAAFDKAIEINPEYADAIVDRAIRTEDSTKKQAGCKKALQIDPQHYEAHMCIITEFKIPSYDLDNIDKRIPTIEAYTRLIKMQPLNPKAYSFRASTYRDVGDEYYERCTRNIGGWHRGAEIYDAKRFECNKFLTIKPKDSDKDMAFSYYKKSLADLDKVIEIDPNNADNYSDRCSFRAEYLKDHKGALADCKKALAIEPDIGSHIFTLARAMEELGDFKSACKYYKRACSLGGTQYCPLGAYKDPTYKKLQDWVADSIWKKSCL